MYAWLRWLETKLVKENEPEGKPTDFPSTGETNYMKFYKSIINYFLSSEIMKNSIKTLIFSTIVIAFVALSCSKSDSDSDSESKSISDLDTEGGPFEINELAGNWEATSAFFLRASDDLLVDIVGEGGSVSLTVQSNGKCTFTIDPFDREAYAVSGKMFWELDDETYFLAIIWDNSPDDYSSFIPQFTGNKFDMGCVSECAEYDFNNNGTNDIADLSFFFIRN